VGATPATPQYFGANGPSNLNQWTYSYNDVLTKIVGRHSIKAGGEFTRLYYLNNPVYAARPGFTFHSLWDFANDAPYKESGEFSSKTGIPFSNRQDDRENLWGIFVQDDFKLRSNLTHQHGSALVLLRSSFLYGEQPGRTAIRIGRQSADQYERSRSWEPLHSAE